MTPNRSRRRRLAPALSVLLPALLLAACDSAPGPAPLNPRPPQLTDFTFTPQAVVAEAPPPGWALDGEVVTGTIDLAVTATDPDGAVASVQYVVQSPLAPTTPLAQGVLSPRGGNRYEGTAQVSIPRGAVGNYTVLVFAIDDDNVLGGEARGLLRFLASGNPPVIDAVEADPNPVRPPTTLRLFAMVSDPDGLDNVSRVEVVAPNGGVFQLFDDGQSSGDETADDGRYTASFDVPAGVTPGVQTFRFQAFDRSGLASAVVELDVTVE